MSAGAIVDTPTIIRESAQGALRRVQRVGVIGLGKQAKKEHIPAILRSSATELVAVCDSDGDKVAQAEREFHVAGFTSVGLMLKTAKPDFVVIATPHDQYLQIISEAAAHGVHVLKEKPFARNMREAEAIARYVRESKIKLWTGVQRRFDPIYESFFSLSSAIGTAYFIDVRYTIYTDSPHTGWRGARDTAGGGCIIDMGYHMVDLLIWYFGLPKHVIAKCSASAVPDNKYDAEDTAVIMFEYSESLHGVCVISRSYSPKTEYFRVVGTLGILELDQSGARVRSHEGAVLHEIKRMDSASSSIAPLIEFFSRAVAGSEDCDNLEEHFKHVAFVEACYGSIASRALTPPAAINGALR